ncbi:MAG TPA: DNA-binding protein [Polyangia bacterium]|nr:DNA-binding protein [Polyangia bacterium]
MLPKKQLEQLADVRANEAKTLFNAGFFSGSYYLAGYALEFALKARIAKNFLADAIPERSYVQDIFTHDLKKLMGLAALRKELEQKVQGDPQFAAFWGIASQWDESARYDIWDKVAATAMLVAVCDSQKGLLQWIKQFW